MFGILPFFAYLHSSFVRLLDLSFKMCDDRGYLKTCLLRIEDSISRYIAENADNIPEESDLHQAADLLGALIDSMDSDLPEVSESTCRKVFLEVVKRIVIELLRDKLSAEQLSELVESFSLMGIYDLIKTLVVLL